MTWDNNFKGSKPEDMRTVTPVVNIREKNDTIILESEMPGLEQNNITIHVEGDDLVIAGHRIEEMPKGYAPLYQERIHARYERTFTLGKDIDRTNISAHYENGILSVELRKSEKAQPKKITIG